LTFVIDLPWPPSVNEANAVGKNKKTGKPFLYSGAAKKKFLDDAKMLLMAQKGWAKFNGNPISPVLGEFTYHITLNEAERKPLMDGDNRGKYVLDFLQTAKLIENDKLAHGGSWSWGPCEYGCRVIVKPYQQGNADGDRTQQQRSTEEYRGAY
jgi:hypothetical protein